jgi:hypothetical protein
MKKKRMTLSDAITRRRISFKICSLGSVVQPALHDDNEPCEASRHDARPLRLSDSIERVREIGTFRQAKAQIETTRGIRRHRTYGFAEKIR